VKRSVKYIITGIRLRQVAAEELTNPAPPPAVWMELLPLRNGLGLGRFVLFTWAAVFQSGQVYGSTEVGTWTLIFATFRRVPCSADAGVLQNRRASLTKPVAHARIPSGIKCGLGRGAGTRRKNAVGREHSIDTLAQLRN
jgi:hypothetical protein